MSAVINSLNQLQKQLLQYRETLSDETFDLLENIIENCEEKNNHQPPDQVQDVAKQAQAATQQEGYCEILEKSLNEIYIFDIETYCFTHVNYGARLNLGYTLGELQKMTPLDIKPEITKEFFMEMVTSLLKEEVEILKFSTIHRRKDGSDYPVDVNFQTANCDGKKVFAAIILDMTEQRKAEAELVRAHEELQKVSLIQKVAIERNGRTLRELKFAHNELKEAYEEAKKATRSKSEFLANMSHEIRTPMTAILGFTDFLRTEGDLSIAPKHRIESIDTIERNGQYLLELINDILDLSKIESGQFETERIECSPYAIAKDVVSLLKFRAKEKGIIFNVRIDGLIPEAILSDPTRLRQILVNLAGNAIKFTETGSIDIVIRLLSWPGKEAKIQFDVIDTGIGLKEHQIEKIFQSFSQADTSVTRKYGGTGLGLSISKRLTEILGGDISVSSVIGEGSTFSFTVTTGRIKNVKMIGSDSKEISSEKFKNNEMNEETDHPLQGCRVLIAEDGPDNQRLFGFILEKAGIEVTIAEDGKFAVELANSGLLEGRPFDVILMDMQMPVMDGYTATGNLRSAGYTGSIIALTAHAMAEDKKKCLDAGCDAFLTKPVDRKLLIETITNYVTQNKIASAQVSY